MKIIKAIDIEKVKWELNEGKGKDYTISQIRNLCPTYNLWWDSTSSDLFNWLSHRPGSLLNFYYELKNNL